MRSKYRDTGRNVSFTEAPCQAGSSSCCSTGAGARVAKMSPGSSSTGSRLIVASAAPVTMLVAPGPIEEVQARVERRSLALATPIAVWTIACSFFGW